MEKNVPDLRLGSCIIPGHLIDGIETKLRKSR
jgi:hypothetical protein